MSYAENVKSAALTLDRLVPGWYRKMQPHKLVMDNTSLCALGQLFGHDVEMSIAKELYPEEHAKLLHREGNGFNAGLTWIAKKLTGKSWCDAYRENDEMKFLVGACGGGQGLKCHWANEVADRVAAEGTKVEVENASQ